MMFAVYIKILSITMPKLCLEKKFNKISFSVGKKKIKKNSDISSEIVCPN